MFEASNFLEESISLNPNFDKSSLSLSSGMLGLDEKLAQIKSFSGSSSHQKWLVLGLLAHPQVAFDYYRSSIPNIGGFGGTSAATPNVTGVASLLWSANSNLSAAQVKQILSQTSYDLGLSGYDTAHGSGFVNADAALRRALAIGRGVA
jgi:subtilisin family serine protease